MMKTEISQELSEISNFFSEAMQKAKKTVQRPRVPPHWVVGVQPRAPNPKPVLPTGRQ
jgi:hypothetical protein